MAPILRAVFRRFLPRWIPSTLPPTRMAVAGYLVERPDPNRPGMYLPDRRGEPRDWAWVLRQWDRVAAAGSSVRLVVAEQSYTGLLGSRLTDMTNKLAACRAAGQLVFGYVAGSGGAVPLEPTGSFWSIPRDPNTGALAGLVTRVPPGTPGARMNVGDQIDAWHQMFPGVLDGIYVDEGPSDCLDPAQFGGQANIPGNYAAYIQHIRQFGYQVFLLAALYDDEDRYAVGWLRALQWEFLGLWEDNASRYDQAFNAWNVCANSYTPWPPGNPDASWWDPVRNAPPLPPARRTSRVHIINEGAQVHINIGAVGGYKAAPLSLDRFLTFLNLDRLMRLAMSRGAATVWITESWKDPVLGSVYDQLPPYWSDEVALCG